MQPSHTLHRCLESRHPPCALSFLTGNLKTIFGFNFTYLLFVSLICSFTLSCLNNTAFLPTHLQQLKDPNNWNIIVVMEFNYQRLEFSEIKNRFLEAGSGTARKTELSFPLDFEVSFAIHTDSHSIYEKNPPSREYLDGGFYGPACRKAGLF